VVALLNDLFGTQARGGFPGYLPDARALFASRAAEMAASATSR
jgi:hypothetical protein